MDSYNAEYSLDDKPLASSRSPGLLTTNATAAPAADPEKGKPFVQVLWDQRVPTGKLCYYDGLLMVLGFLHVNSNFRIYEPGVAERTH